MPACDGTSQGGWPGEQGDPGRRCEGPDGGVGSGSRADGREMGSQEGGGTKSALGTLQNLQQSPWHSLHW